MVIILQLQEWSVERKNTSVQGKISRFCKFLFATVHSFETFERLENLLLGNFIIG